MKYADLKSEVARLAKVTMHELKECQSGARYGMPMSVSTNKLESIVTRIENVLFPLADRINNTELRREMLEDLDRIQYAAERFLDAVSVEPLDGPIREGIELLSGVKALADTFRLGQIVSEEITEARVRKSLKTLIEAPQLLPGDVQKLANDSVDVSLDSYFKKAADTLGMTGDANKERAEDGEGQQDFSVVDFASDVANLVDRANVLLDLDGAIARRAYNYVSQNHGPDAAENFKQVLEANFDIYMESQPDMEGERNAMRPAAVGAGAGSGGEAASGGGGGEGGAP